MLLCCCCSKSRRLTARRAVMNRRREVALALFCLQPTETFACRRGRSLRTSIVCRRPSRSLLHEPLSSLVVVVATLVVDAHPKAARKGADATRVAHVLALEHQRRISKPADGFVRRALVCSCCGLPRRRRRAMRRLFPTSRTSVVACARAVFVAATTTSAKRPRPEPVAHMNVALVAPIQMMLV